jgi:AraC-like DNA-binding protein
MARYALEPAISDFLLTRSGYFPRCWHNSAWRPEPLPLHETVVSICLEGRGWVKDVHHADRPNVPISPGDVLVVPSDTPHAYNADEKDPWTQLWFHATGPRVAQFLAQLRVTGGPYKGRVSNLGMVMDSMHRINELRQQGCGRAVLLESAALGELVLARLYAESCLEPAWSGRRRGNESGAAERVRKLNRVTAFLQENSHRNLPMTEMAQACHVSESWLYHTFPAHSGFTPLGFIIHLRLQEACCALATTERKMEDIAAAVGYNDWFYFSRLFKKHLGLSPSGYRRKYGALSRADA